MFKRDVKLWENLIMIRIKIQRIGWHHMIERRAANQTMERGGGICREEAWAGGWVGGKPDESFVPRRTIIIVTFDQVGALVSFMDRCLFSKLPPHLGFSRLNIRHTQTRHIDTQMYVDSHVCGCT